MTLYVTTLHVTIVCNTCIDKPVYAPRGPFMKVGNVLYKNIKLQFFLKVIMWVFHDKDNEGIA
jgi:hypothetical protein